MSNQEYPTPIEMPASDLWDGHGLIDSCPEKKTLARIPGFDVIDTIVQMPDGLKRGREAEAAHSVLSRLIKSARTPIYTVVSGQEFNLKSLGRASFIRFEQENSHSPENVISEIYYGLVTREKENYCEVFAYTEEQLHQDFRVALRTRPNHLMGDTYTVGERVHQKLNGLQILHRINNVDVLLRTPAKERRVKSTQLMPLGIMAKI